MTSADTLSLRLQDIRDQVARVKKAVDQAADPEDRLYERVQGRLAELVRRSEDLLGEVESLGAAGTNGDEASAKLRDARRASTLLFRESFAFVEGALSRRAQLDDGFCELADKLLDSLDTEDELNWRGLTVLAETSFYGEAAEVIRLKYPELSIWHLPVAVHEFGHFANPEIRVKVREGSVWRWTYPVQAILDREAKRDARDWFHAHELFADVFAIYALGPAYAYSSLLLRPDSGGLRAASPTHPSWDQRYFVIVEALERVSLHGGASGPIIADVKSRWDELRTAQDGSEPRDAKKLRRLFDRFYPLLDENLAGVRYSSFGRAQQLVEALSDDAQPPPPLDGVRLADVLNAAWLARLGELANARRTEFVERRALDALRAI